MLLIIFAAVILSLRFRLFPFFYSDLSSAEYWAMASVTGAGIALSVIAHEAVHLFVAWRLGETPHGVLLYLFGNGTPPARATETRAKSASLYLSGIGTSLLLSAVLVGLAYISAKLFDTVFPIRVLFHLAAFNTTLAVFQLLPVLPLDGGRFLLRALSRGGAVEPRVFTAFYFLGLALSLAMAVAGAYQIFKGRPVLGAWIVAVGLLLLRANVEEQMWVYRNR